ncbi:MAG: cobalamin B12-binding domain-containing protein [Armatimonadota bacterium]
MLKGLSERRRIAAELRRLKRSQAEKITEELRRRSPVCQEHPGEAARTRGIEDTADHIAFLASAVEAGSPEAFREYARWTTRMLASRGIQPHLIAESLRGIAEGLSGDLDAEAERTVREFVEAAAAECTVDAIDDSDPRERLTDLQSTYLQAILTGERRAARQIALDAIDSGLGLEELYADVFQECMHTVGELWETNRISVADEHMATAITQSVMAEVYQRVPWSEQTRGNVVLTGVQGEMHQIGPHLVADALDIRGWNVRFLGANVPHRDVLQAVEEHEADILGISTTVLFNTGFALDIIEQARDRFGEKLRIVVGGAAFRLSPDIVAEIGAAACALNLQEAVAAFDQLAPEAGGG